MPTKLRTSLDTRRDRSGLKMGFDVWPAEPALKRLDPIPPALAPAAVGEPSASESVRAPGRTPDNAQGEPTSAPSTPVPVGERAVAAADASIAERREPGVLSRAAAAIRAARY